MALPQHIQEEVSRHLTEMQILWKPGVKITFFVRVPFLKDGDLLLTQEEDIETAIEAMRHLNNNTPKEAI